VDEILFLIKELQGMAINPKYIEFIKDVEEKTLIYKERKGFG